MIVRYPHSQKSSDVGIANIGVSINTPKKRKDIYHFVVSMLSTRKQMIFVAEQKGEPIAMAEIKFPIQVDLPDDWIEQIVNRLRNDPEAEWVEIVRCGQCKYAEVADKEDAQDGYTCQFHRGSIWFSGSYCSWAERRQDG